MPWNELRPPLFKPRAGHHAVLNRKEAEQKAKLRLYYGLNKPPQDVACLEPVQAINLCVRFSGKLCNMICDQSTENFTVPPQSRDNGVGS